MPERFRRLCKSMCNLYINEFFCRNGMCTFVFCITSVPILMYFLTHCGQWISSSVQYLPFDINLDTKKKVNSSHIDCIHIVWVSVSYLSVCELLFMEPFSIFLLIDSYHLDSLLLSGTFRTLHSSKNSYHIFKHWVQKLIQIYLYYLSVLNSISFEVTALWIHGLQILLSSNIEKNPGPANNQNNSFLLFFLL